MNAIPVDEFVWCTSCGTPHSADLKADPPVIRWSDPQECEEIKPDRERVKDLPSDWEEKYIALFGDYDHKTRTQYYDLYPKAPELLWCHRPMMYLEEEDE